MSDKFLIVGLGNPGREYRLNRHNVGFMLLDRLVERHDLPLFTRRQSRALLTTGRIGARAVILAKPQTFMNLSGEAVSGLMRFYDLPPERLLVCLDDIDLPVGALRLRPGGGSAGQKGLQSILEQLGTSAIARLRLGVGRPTGRKGAAAHVLQDLRGEDLELVSAALDRAADAVEVFLSDGLERAMNRFNAAAPAAGESA